MSTTEKPTSLAEIEHERIGRVSLTRYFGVWLALTGLTFLTFGLSRIHLGGWDVVIVLVIAVVKSLLVVLFFMHLWESRGSIPLVLAVTMILLITLIILSITDLTARFQLTLPQPALENGAVK